jgi:hypothetical protein
MSTTAISLEIRSGMDHVWESCIGPLSQRRHNPL